MSLRCLLADTNFDEKSAVVVKFVPLHAFYLYFALTVLLFSSVLVFSGLTMM